MTWLGGSRKKSTHMFWAKIFQAAEQTIQELNKVEDEFGALRDLATNGFLQSKTPGGDTGLLQKELLDSNKAKEELEDKDKVLKSMQTEMEATVRQLQGE